MTEKLLEGRELNQTVRDLKAHVQWKLDALPRLAKERNLSNKTIASLQSELQAELDYLSTVPNGVTLKEVMESHFERGAKVRGMITGEK